MDVSYRLDNSQIEKLKKYKNPSISLKKEKYFKKWEIQITFDNWYV